MVFITARLLRLKPQFLRFTCLLISQQLRVFRKSHIWSSNNCIAGFKVKLLYWVRQIYLKLFFFFVKRNLFALTKNKLIENRNSFKDKFLIYLFSFFFSLVTKSLLERINRTNKSGLEGKNNSKIDGAIKKESKPICYKNCFVTHEKCSTIEGKLYQDW